LKSLKAKAKEVIKKQILRYAQDDILIHVILRSEVTKNLFLLNLAIRREF